MDNEIQPPAPQLVSVAVEFPQIETFLREVEINGQKVWRTFARLDQLRPDPNNPRDISDEAEQNLIDFLQRYQPLKPLLVDFRPEKMGQLIGGNKRFGGYRKLGVSEVWIEPRVPASDAQAFEMATIDNMEFGHYVEEKLKAEVQKYEAELGDDIKKLEAQLKESTSFKDLLKPQKPKDHKFEIIIRCVDESDYRDKFDKIASLGIPLKTK